MIGATCFYIRPFSVSNRIVGVSSRGHLFHSTVPKGRRVALLLLFSFSIAAACGPLSRVTHSSRREITFPDVQRYASARDLTRSTVLSHTYLAEYRPLPWTAAQYAIHMCFISTMYRKINPFGCFSPTPVFAVQ